jgi:hypothetical protein
MSALKKIEFSVLQVSRLWKTLGYLTSCCGLVIVMIPPWIVATYLALRQHFISNMVSCGLPSTFTSLYRTFLRTQSASVLHHKVAKRNLRKLWRPVFDDAVVVVKKLQNGASDNADRERLEKWLQTWECRSEFGFVVVVNIGPSNFRSGPYTLYNVQLCQISWSFSSAHEEPFLALYGPPCLDCDPLQSSGRLLET